MRYVLLLLLFATPAAAQSYNGWRDMHCGPGTWPCPVTIGEPKQPVTVNVTMKRDHKVKR